MTFLKQSCDRAATLRLPRVSDFVEIQRVADRLRSEAMARQEDRETWDDFVERLDLPAPSLIKARDVRRLLEEIWDHESLDDATAPVIDAGVVLSRKSIDRTIIESYLRHFPTSHVAFEHLKNAAALVSGRHDWRWRDRGPRWELWDHEGGPTRLARALLASDDPVAILRDVGLDGDLATGKYARDALLKACETGAGQHGDEATQAGRRLITIFERFPKLADLNAALAYALLAPWIQGSCSENHQRQVSALLVKRIGDPRLYPGRWTAIKARIRDWFPGADADATCTVLRRWLVQATVREFFSVVAKTVERRDQWRERTDFWMAYLDAGAINEAWFGFGSTAARMARSLMDNTSVEFAELQGSGATSAQSALVFSIGDLRIAEWSDNGSCRFWHVDDQGAPRLYERKYVASRLRAMVGGAGFAAIPHSPPNGWQPKFARHVYRMTGVRHPRHGAGW